MAEPAHEVHLDITPRRAQITLRAEGRMGYGDRGFAVPIAQIDAASRAAERVARALLGSPAPPARKGKRDA
jgi:hypothetical protein